MRLAAASSDRVRVRELGKTSSNNPFIALEISAPETLKNLDRYKQLERKLYFQGGTPTDAERDEIFRQGKLVLLITCSIHATEIGASQMSLELVHRLATDDSPAVKKILDNVIFVLVPSLNPDGQIMVTDWFNKNVGTDYATSPIPVPLSPLRRPRQQPRHVHVHAEGKPVHGAAALARLVPVGVARRAPDGQQRRAHLRDAGDRSDQPERAPADLSLERHPRAVAGGGARSGRQGRHHLQLDLHRTSGKARWRGAAGGTTRSACSPKWRARASRRRSTSCARAGPAPAVREAGAPEAGRGASAGGGRFGGGPIAAPTDITSRTEYPRPWLGGRWTLRDIVDYELIATMGCSRRRRIGARRSSGRSTRSTARPSTPAGTAPPSSILDPGRAPAGPAGSRAPRREAADGRHRRLPRRRRVRGRRHDLRGRDVRDSDDAGVRALCEGHAREAELSGSAARPQRAARAALRRDRVVARHAARRRHRVRGPAAAVRSR